MRLKLDFYSYMGPHQIVFLFFFLSDKSDMMKTVWQLKSVVGRNRTALVSHFRGVTVAVSIHSHSVQGVQDVRSLLNIHRTINTSTVAGEEGCNYTPVSVIHRETEEALVVM